MTERTTSIHDHVTKLPTRLDCLAHIAESGHRDASGATAKTLVLVTLAEAVHFNQILRALGQGFSEDFVRAGAERLTGVVPAGTRLFHVSVLSFAFTVDAGSLKAAQTGHGPEPMIATALRSAFDSPIVVDNIPIKPHAGIGLLSLDAPERDPSESLRAALTAAQDSRRLLQGWAWYDHKSDAAHQRAFRLLTDLAPAIERSELELYYQPRIDLASLRCSSAEALLRWRHPELGWISPGEFIPLAETTAIIEPLTRWVLTSAVGQLGAWNRKGLDVKLSVNVSARNLALPGWADELLGLLSAERVHPRSLEIEVTESALLEGNQTVQEHVARVREHGIDVAIDDFGSGYSNLSYLTKLNAGVLKIDQSFLRGMNGKGDRFLMEQIVSIGRGLGYRVVAEGVEDLDALQLVNDLGCHEAQGYHFAKPLERAAFEAWLAEWKGGAPPPAPAMGAAQAGRG